MYIDKIMFSRLWSKLLIIYVLPAKRGYIYIYNHQPGGDGPRDIIVAGLLQYQILQAIDITFIYIICIHIYYNQQPGGDGVDVGHGPPRDDRGRLPAVALRLGACARGACVCEGARECMRACVCARVRVCVHVRARTRACVRSCVCARARVREWGDGLFFCGVRRVIRESAAFRFSRVEPIPAAERGRVRRACRNPVPRTPATRTRLINCRWWW
jgi:hypothetical protein